MQISIRCSIWLVGVSWCASTKASHGTHGVYRARAAISRRLGEKRCISAVPVGFFGLDLSGLHTSIDADLTYMDKGEPESALRAWTRYNGCDHFGDDPQVSDYFTSSGVT